jgi:hypothetical protein
VRFDEVYIDLRNFCYSVQIIEGNNDKTKFVNTKLKCFKMLQPDYNTQTEIRLRDLRSL